MALKVTFKEWIILFLLVGVSIAITGFLITFFFDVSGYMITMIALIIIFVVFKGYQYLKKGSSEDNVDLPEDIDEK